MKLPPSSLPEGRASLMPIINDDDWAPPSPKRKQRKPPEPVRSETQRTGDVLEWMNAQPRTYAMKKHTGVYGESGHPDIFGCRAGRMVLVEMKRPGEKPTKQQMQRLRDWQKAGAAVCWAFDVEHVRQLFERMDADEKWTNPLDRPGAP